MKRFTFILSVSIMISTFAMTLASCGGGGKIEKNPFFAEWDTPYGVPPFDQIEARHYKPAFERAFSLHNEEIAAIVENSEEPSFENTVEAYDRSGIMLSDVMNVFSMLCAADTSEQMQKIEADIMPRLSAHYDGILLNDALFGRIKPLYDRRASLDLDDEQMRLLEKVYNDFVRSGALLDEEDKDRLMEINGELSLLSVRFGNNILAENNNFVLEIDSKQASALPSSLRDAARQKAVELGMGDDSYAITLHAPSIFPFLTSSPDRELREKAFKGYINRCNNGDKFDNKQNINDIIRLRIEKANLLGYKSYADYVISDQMAGSPEAVYALLDEIWTPANERAKQALEQMQELFRRDVREDDARFEAWDWWYYAEKIRRQEYSLNEEMLRPYFVLDNVRQGAFLLANRLYGITFRPVVLPHYNSECSAYEVLDADESHLGVLYFDFFPRDGKGQGAWCGYFREPRYEEGKRLAPHVSIVCNFSRPTDSTPSLLTVDEVQTLFHEFGHALHFLFTDVKYRRLASVEGDFVELPSQIMENWAFEPELLRNYAVHYRTDNVISDSYIDRIRRSALFNQGFMTTELIAASLTDLDIHSLEKYEQLDVDGFEYNALYEKRKMLTQIEPRYHYNYFAHIFSGGYSSGYYFYTWAAVLDKDAFEAFSASGDVFNRKIAAAFRREVLARGGAEDGMTLYRNFRGAEPDKIPMLKARGLWQEPEPEEVTAEDTETFGSSR